MNISNTIKKSITTVLVLCIVIAGALAAFSLTSEQKKAGTGKLTVTATYYPLYDFAKQVGGDKVVVANMTPNGAEPHDFEPPVKDLGQAQESAVFIYNGGTLEPWVDGFLSGYSHEAIKVSKGIPLRSDGVVRDPHFWLDPVLAQQIVNTIRDGLSRADPTNQGYYAANAERYNQKLAALDLAFADGLAHCALHTVISSHEAFSYVAARYNFKVTAIAGIEPSEEPSPAKMAEITATVRREGIRYIFFESLVSPRLADTIASETGAKTLVFDPIEGLSQAEQMKGKEYSSVQYDNLKNLKKALECR